MKVHSGVALRAGLLRAPLPLGPAEAKRRTATALASTSVVVESRMITLLGNQSDELE